MSNSTTESDANKKFTFGTRVGMLLIVEASAMSALAVISVLLYIALITMSSGLFKQVGNVGVTL
ncbi:hypothetical protein ID866_12233, partial [Astraeus odoratus]